MNVLTGHDEAVAEYVRRQVGCDAFCPPYSAIGVIDGDGYLVGGFVFNNFTGPNIEVSLAGRGAVSRRGLRAAARYVFDQLGCRRVTAHCKASNLRVILQAERGGWVREGMHANWFFDDDAASLGLTRERCKW